MAASAAPAAAVPPGAGERPQLSARATSPPAPPPRAQQKSARGWWIVPLVVVGLVLIAWLVLAGLPFGGEDARTIPTERPSDVIAEANPAARPAEPTGTVIELPGDPDFSTTVANAPPNLEDPTATILLGQQAPATATTTPPPAAPNATQPAVTPRPSPARPASARDEPMYSSQREPATPAPRTTSRPAATPAPKPPTPKPAPAPTRAEPKPAPASSVITEGEASSHLHGYLRGYYSKVNGNCLEVRSHGYKNEGYTMTAWNACDSSGGSRMLHRWRVDAKTKEIFRQRDNGKYLAP